MVVEWVYATIERTCGGCGERILRGEAMRLSQAGGIGRKLIRCQKCAGAPPVDLQPTTPAVAWSSGVTMLDPLRQVPPRRARRVDVKWWPRVKND